MTTLPAKGITPRPEVERQGDGDDVLGKRLDPVEVGQLSLDPEYSNDMLLCYCGNNWSIIIINRLLPHVINDKIL